MKVTNDLIWFFTVLALSYFAIAPLFIAGFFPVHDDTQVARVFTMQKSLADGMFPVRWVSDLGYGFGYPIFNFYAPLAYYFGGLLDLLGFDAITATKVMMGLGMIFAAFSMYLLAKEFWGTMGGVVAGVLYLYAPFHAVDLYVRGDVAELWAYAFIPLVFYGLWKLYKHKSWKNVFVTAISYAAIILSHNLTAMMVTPFVIAVVIMFSIVLYKRKQLFAIRYLLYAISLGVLLSAFYWLPALLEMQYTNVLGQIGGGADFRDHFVCLSQLWESQWGFGGSVPGCLDGLSFRIGKIHILLSLVAVVLLFLHRKDKEKRNVLFFAFFCLLFSVLILLPTAKPLWETIPLMAFFQYPWRFLLLIAFFSSFIGGSVLWFLQKHSKQKSVLFVGASIIIAASFFLYIKLFNPQTVGPKTESELTSRQAIAWTASKISDEYMPKGFAVPKNEQDISSQQLEIIKGEAIINSAGKNTYNIQLLKPTTFKANIAYFPAIVIYAYGKKVPFTITPRGLTFPLNFGRDIFGHPTGGVYLRIAFEQTPIEKVANMVSLASILILVVGIIYQRKRGIRL